MLQWSILMIQHSSWFEASSHPFIFSARKRNDQHPLVCYQCAWFLNIFLSLWYLSHLSPFKWSKTVHDTGHVISTLLRKTWCNQATFRSCWDRTVSYLNVTFLWTGCTRMHFTSLPSTWCWPFDTWGNKMAHVLSNHIHPKNAFGNMCDMLALIIFWWVQPGWASWHPGRLED